MDFKEKEFLNDVLEKLLFDKSQLTILKNEIEKVVEGSLTPKKLRKQIIDFRIEIMERLLEYFPFYLKYTPKQNQINNFIKTSDDLSEELKEKDKLLKEIGIRVKKIYENLKNY